jgi:hypothetical protein
MMMVLHLRFVPAENVDLRCRNALGLQLLFEDFQVI